MLRVSSKIICLRIERKYNPSNFLFGASFPDVLSTTFIGACPVTVHLNIFNKSLFPMQLISEFVFSPSKT